MKQFKNWLFCFCQIEWHDFNYADIYVSDNLLAGWQHYNIYGGMLIHLLYKKEDCCHCYSAHGNYPLVCGYTGTLYIPFSFVPSATAPWCPSSACLVHSYEPEEAGNKRNVNDYNEVFQRGLFLTKCTLERLNQKTKHVDVDNIRDTCVLISIFPWGLHYTYSHHSYLNEFIGL